MNGWGEKYERSYWGKQRARVLKEITGKGGAEAFQGARESPRNLQE